jgi:hypothetical protein
MAGAVATLDYDAELMLRVKHGDAATFSLRVYRSRATYEPTATHCEDIGLLGAGREVAAVPGI